MTRLAPFLAATSLILGGCWMDGVAGDAKPLPEPTATEAFRESGDMYIVEPVSAPIEMNQKYRFERTPIADWTPRGSM